jgi:hypothetical protein
VRARGPRGERTAFDPAGSSAVRTRDDDDDGGAHSAMPTPRSHVPSRAPQSRTRRPARAGPCSPLAARPQFARHAPCIGRRGRRALARHAPLGFPRSARHNASVMSPRTPSRRSPLPAHHHAVTGRASAFTASRTRTPRARYAAHSALVVVAIAVALFRECRAQRLRSFLGRGG